MAITDKYRLEDDVTESLDFADFVRQRSTPMLRTAWLLTGGDWALAEDLAQTAFSQVWRHWNRVAVMEAPESYAHKVMLNTFLSWRRRRWTTEISTERFVVSPVTTGGFATVDMREVLRHALRQLTAKQRAVIALRYFEDRSETETAAIMGCTVGTDPWIGGATGSSAELAVIGNAPDINGRPAKWLAGGLEWEYATGGWATILTGGETVTQSKAGWGQNCKINIPKASATSTGAATPTRVTSGMLACSPLAQQTAALQAELVKVASNLSWTPTPFTFPYKFTKALPKGWTVGSVTGTFVKGRLISSELDLDSAAIPVAHPMGDEDNVIDIQAWSDPSGHSYCPAMPTRPRTARSARRQ